MEIDTDERSSANQCFTLNKFHTRMSFCQKGRRTPAKEKLIYSDCNRRYPLTYHYTITEEQLVKLACERGEEAAQGGDQSTHDRC